MGLRCRPEQMTQASIRKAPMNMPGKKPARKTPTGNLLHVDSAAEDEEFTPVERGVDVAVVLLVDVAVFEAVEEVADEVVEVEVLFFPSMLVLAISWQIGDCEDVTHS